VQTLDPQAKDTISDFAIACNFYDPLVQTDYNQKVRPCLARSWENPDALTWVFHLRRNVQFHDGTPMTAKDVAYSFHRVMSDPSMEMKEYITNISDITVIDPYTIKITTAYAANVFLQKLNFIMIIPANSNPATLNEHVNGTGAYKLRSWKKNESIEMIRNDRYFEEKPALRNVVFELGRSPEESIRDLQSGRCQLVQCNSRSVEKQIHEGSDYELLFHDSLFIKYLGFDLARDDTPHSSVHPNPFKKLEVRKAIDSAIDRTALTAKLSTFAVPASQPVPPFVFGYDPETKTSPYDINKAEELLASAGYPSGFNVVLNTRKILAATALLVKDDLAKIHIGVDVRVLSDPDWYAQVNDASFFITRLGCPTGDASDVLTMAIHSKENSRRLGTKNYEGYSNPEVDRLIEQSLATGDNEKRGRTMQQLMRRVTEEVVWIPLYADQEVYAINKMFSWHPRNDSYILAEEISLRQTP